MCNDTCSKTRSRGVVAMPATPNGSAGLSATLAGLLSLVLAGAGLAGDMVIDGNYRYSNAKVNSYWIPGNTFITLRDNNDEETYGRRVHGWGVLRSSISSSVDLIAPVRLPDGATVKDLICFYYDNFEANRLKCINNTTMTLRRRGGTDLVSTTMASIDVETCLTPASPAMRFLEDNTIDDPVIDNFRYSYHLDVHWQASDQVTEHLRFYGCVIDYLVTEVAP